MLLGQRDEPTDAVEDHCRYLGEALRPRGYALEIVRVPWKERGWFSALRELWKNSREWAGAWVLLQYTALAWSRKGFGTGALWVLKTLSTRLESRINLGVVFHDVLPYAGSRTIDHIRRVTQVFVMRHLVQRADRVFLTVSQEQLPWFPRADLKVLQKTEPIASGANLIPPLLGVNLERKAKIFTVAVFGVTGGIGIEREAREIAHAANYAAQKVGRIRLVVLGRGSLDAQEALLRQLDVSRIELATRGVLPADQVGTELARSDVLLFVRGHVSTRRSSALAGIACGLPLVAYRGAETGPPITEAGLLLAAEGDRNGLAQALAHVLTDRRFREDLAELSRRTYGRYFSWEAIAARYVEALNSPNSGPTR